MRNENGTPVFEYRLFTESEMQTILKSNLYTAGEKAKVNKLYLQIERAMKQLNAPRSRFIPMMNTAGKTFVWFD